MNMEEDTGEIKRRNFQRPNRMSLKWTSPAPCQLQQTNFKGFALDIIPVDEIARTGIS